MREKDGFHIPYETVDAITLIALVRLNLVPGFKDLLYDSFLKMGVYEDMAPWNIAFRGGRLIYIDYDTRDIDLTKHVPMAYQVWGEGNFTLERKDLFFSCPLCARCPSLAPLNLFLAFSGFLLVTQVMAALMNLERTVKDFGHCPGHGKNAYNIPFVSHCVGQSVYTGPCEDDRSVCGEEE